jgi:hypothetical protein
LQVSGGWLIGHGLDSYFVVPENGSCHHGHRPGFRPSRLGGATTRRGNLAPGRPEPPPRRNRRNSPSLDTSAPAHPRASHRRSHFRHRRRRGRDPEAIPPRRQLTPRPAPGRIAFDEFGLNGYDGNSRCVVAQSGWVAVSRLQPPQVVSEEPGLPIPVLRIESYPAGSSRGAAGPCRLQGRTTTTRLPGRRGRTAMLVKRILRRLFWRVD